jgi:hypothetical protein
MMLSAPPPQGAPRSLSQQAQTPANTSLPRKAFVCSLLSVVGVTATWVGALWAFGSADLNLIYGALAILVFAILLAGSLTLAILGLSRSVSWRRAGGRGGRSVLSIVLASLGLFSFVVPVLVFIVELVAIFVTFSSI